MANMFFILNYFFVFSNKYSGKYNGIDHRINNDQQFRNEINQLYKINIIFEKYKLLNTLKSQHISNKEKIILANDLLEINSVKIFNIKAGGLYNDFYNI